MLRHASMHRRHQCRAAYVADLGAVFDELDFFGRLDHAQLHHIGGYIGKFNTRQSGADFVHTL